MVSTLNGTPSVASTMSERANVGMDHGRRAPSLRL